MKVIEQDNCQTIEITDFNSCIRLDQAFDDGGENYVVVDKSFSRELALSICPELGEEIERMKENHRCALMVIHNNNLQSAYIAEQLKSK
jgi:hypothetical protein